jgi:hypothetical protein
MNNYRRNLEFLPDFFYLFNVLKVVDFRR